MPVPVSPLVDITSLRGIQSVFGRGTRDPWGEALAGAFADLYIYAGEIRFPLPTDPSLMSASLASIWQQAPLIAQELFKRDPTVLKPILFSGERQERLRDEHVKFFDHTAAWLNMNANNVVPWLDLHRRDPHMVEDHERRIRSTLLFNTEILQNHSAFRPLTQNLKVSDLDIFYLFDVGLRYPIYGSMAGLDHHSLCHPMRSNVFPRQLLSESSRITEYPCSFGPTVAKMASTMNLKEYVELLHTLRMEARSRGLHLLTPGDFRKEAIRELAVKAELSPRLRHLDKLVEAAGKIFGEVFFSAPKPVVNGAVAITKQLWSGQLPRGAAKLTWLRWAIDWEVVNQAKN